MDLDDILGYSTKKVVFIRDRWIGGCYYLLVVVVVLYVFGIQMFQNNDQFLLRDVSGMPRMKVSHPTKNNCEASSWDCESDFRSLEELPFCNVYTGSAANDHRAPCRFEDVTSVMPGGEVDNKIFIPTAVEIMTEKRVCRPGPENGYSCKNEYVELPGSDCLDGQYMCKTRGGLSDQFYYVADVKNFLIQFTSSYEQGEVHGTSLDHPAYYEYCPSLVREKEGEKHLWTDRLKHSEKSKCAAGEAEMVKLPCMQGVDCSQKGEFDLVKDMGVDKAIKIKIPGETGDKPSFLDSSASAWPSTRQGPPPRLRAALGLDAEDTSLRRAKASSKNENATTSRHAGPEDQAEYTSFWGDHFKVSRLFELSGADLDLDYNFDGWTTRQSGTVLEVSAVYNNLYPFYSTLGYKEVNYHYKVRELPMPYMSRSRLAPVQPDDYPETRRYEIRHGVLVWFKVGGEFGVYKTSYLLLMLVTGFALVGTATTITDLIACYISKRKNNYFNLKYEVSPDFSEMWQCSKCNYMNSSKRETCQGYEMWQCHHEEEFCGAARPS